MNRKSIHKVMLVWVTLSLCFTLPSQAQIQKKSTNLVVLAWSLSEADATAWENQPCARLIRSLTDDRKYDLKFSNATEENKNAVIFYTLLHTNGKGAAVIKCGQPD